MNRRVRYVALILFRELVRDRIFLTLGATAFFLVATSLILNEMVVGDRLKASKDLGLSQLNLFA